jgi:hypothetical protein
MYDFCTGPLQAGGTLKRTSDILGEKRFGPRRDGN